MTTAEMVNRARAGDTAVWEDIMGHYHAPLFSYAYRMLADADEAHDVVGEGIAKAFHALPKTTDPELNLGAWLYRIVGNQALDVLRRRQRLRWQPWNGPAHDHLSLASPVDEPGRALEQAETVAAVRRALASMSRRHRRAMLLREFDGLSCEEIGEAMGMSRSAVKSMLFRAREEFRRCWEIEQPGPPPVGRPRRLPRVVTAWTAAEAAIVREMRAAGHNSIAIGAALGRSGKSVRGYIGWVSQREGDVA